MLLRCDDCGGLLSGRHNGFEAVCRCFNPKRSKRRPLFKEKTGTKEQDDQGDIEKIVTGSVGVEEI